MAYLVDCIDFTRISACLCPLLFLIYISDIGNRAPGLSIKLFADDTLRICSYLAIMLMSYRMMLLDMLNFLTNGL